MTLLLTSCAWLLLVVTLIARAFLQQRAVPPLDGGGLAIARSVTVVIPARNERDNIAACLSPLLDQQSVDLTIVVVDDDSSDGTADIVARLAETAPRLHLVQAPPLPVGWKGKVHACAVGAAEAKDGDWLCFMDADVRALDARTIATAVEAAEKEKMDLLSLAPKQQLVSFAERLILPCGLYLLGFLEDFSKGDDADDDRAFATGQFLLFRRQAYEAIGGHGCVRGEICEDTAIARQVKRTGGHVVLRDGSRLLSTRMYDGWQTLWPGFAKNLTDMLGGPMRTMLIALAAFVLAWTAILLPLLDARACFGGIDAACIALPAASAASLAMLALHVAGALHLGIPAWYGILFPIGYSAGALIGLDSVRWRMTRRVRWKGRVYP
ncbi:MAG: glycosyltransferase [Pararhizobium sp.]